MLHMVVATILLERTGTVAVGIIITVLIFTLGFTEHYGLLTHYHLDGFYGGFEPFDSWLFVIGISSVISAMNICLAGLVYLMMLEIKRRRDTIIALSTELEDKNSILLKMDERRKQTMAVASHDLKSPIDAVSSYLNMLQAGYLGEMSPKQLDVVEKSINRLKRLREFVCDVLDWQTIERGELQQIMEQVHIRDIVSSVVDDYKDVAVKKNITLEFTFDDNLPMVNASPRRMAQVFDNLISNAVKYTDNGGTVSVSVQLKDSSVSISVKDSGIGLSDDDMSHLFEDFYRAPRVKKNYDGTGLGLSVVKRIVAAHHGTVTAESRLDHGTEFIVSLPVK
jgi:signal transduction histidine kinase